MAEPALTDDEARAVREALRALAGEQPGVPFAKLARLAQGVDGRPLRLDFESAARVGAPVVVVAERSLAEAVVAPLSPREREVAAAIARGLPNKQIARDLGISLATVKDHVHRTLAKTGARSRTELAAWLARPRP
jgi:DNA-binding NarL/FixJ family response regulator